MALRNATSISKRIGFGRSATKEINMIAMKLCLRIMPSCRSLDKIQIGFFEPMRRVQGLSELRCRLPGWGVRGLARKSAELVLALILAAITSVAQAAEGKIERIDIKEIGVYSGVNREAVPEVGVAGGQRVKSANLKLETSTDRVPARAGTMFGFRYQIVGQPLGEPVLLKFVTRFPRPGLIPPGSRGEPVTVNEYTSPRAIGDIFWRGYGFDEPWELVPGVWTFEIWSGDNKLIEKSFTVYFCKECR